MSILSILFNAQACFHVARGLCNSPLKARPMLALKLFQLKFFGLGSLNARGLGLGLRRSLVSGCSCGVWLGLGRGLLVTISEMRITYPPQQNGVLPNHQWQSVSTPPQNSAAGIFGLQKGFGGKSLATPFQAAIRSGVRHLAWV
jgi:hypothetical protein